MLNTIRLLYGSAELTNSEWEHFEKGNTIFRENSNPKELKRWNIEDKEEALKELNNYRCTYKRRNDHIISIEEYYLEYFMADEDGEFIEGSDFHNALEIDYVNYKSKLKAVRESRGLTQKDLADKSKVNLRMIEHYEQGNKDFKKASAETVHMLAKALECDMEDLLEDMSEAITEE